uniref:Uncharacterized protein n=1 Tax=Anguilla anguilla TaxID=7936 RepID=A0A0E9P7E5_ANGAN
MVAHTICCKSAVPRDSLQKKLLAHRLLAR